MSGDNMDLTELTAEELHALGADLEAELDRRAVATDAPVLIDRILTGVLEATGHEPGDEWVQPTGYENAYPKDWQVTHGGKQWVSLIGGNTLEPGVSGWREVTTEGDAPPEYVPPQGYQDAYNEGDRVTFDGGIYECLEDGTTWSPLEAPARWRKIGGTQ